MTGNSHKGSPAIGRLHPADRRADTQKETENRPLSLLKHRVLLRVQIVDLHMVVDGPPGAVGVGRHADIMRAVV